MKIKIKRSQPSAAPTGALFHSAGSGWLSGRLRWQASSHKGLCFISRDLVAVRPSLRAMGNKKIQQIAGAAETL
ncbi:hypothetical protein IMW75_17145 [Pseudomonas gregormendelii]|uniref:Uncharacterized protein n=1 Tax=Pseudomonas gregormendelii TaxID=1628277 RepID=A0ABS3AIK5_9PSED|nr:hypothetical protein [Pseudomonas gregormendelii]MBN3966994.1 hypothetical protein [Pseudomonas gregormendelii]